MKKYSLITGILLFSLVVLGGGILNKERTLEPINQNENIELAIYREEEQTNSIPSKDSGYYLDLEKSSCTNDASITWDSETWSPVILNA